MAKTKRQSRSLKNRTVSVKKAVNGYIVEVWGDGLDNSRFYIAKTKAEAKKFTSSLLGK